MSQIYLVEFEPIVVAVSVQIEDQSQIYLVEFEPTAAA